jgi:glycosyltransferase involved in cell wall biosynthesis
MPKKVMIGTATYDGKVDVWYTNSLLGTLKLAWENNIDIYPLWISNDALVQRARNDLMALFLESDCDDIILIDSDIEWNPEWIFRLLDHPVDVVGGTYPKKSDNESYVCKLLNLNQIKDSATGLLEVDGLGTGFLKLSKRAVQDLWDSSQPYEEKGQNKIRRLIFDLSIKDGDLVSEDIHACMKLKNLGFSIWLDPKITCNHIGVKKYSGNFDLWFNMIKRQNLTPPSADVSYSTPKNRYMENK